MKAPIFAGTTDTGRQRDHNEDAFVIAADLGVAMVADGMGGHAAGEVASGMAIDTTLAILRQTAGLAARDRLETSLQAANAGIREKAASSPRYKDMGTTVVAALLDRQGLTVAHCGDSRLYRLRRGELLALTRDHSLLQEFIDKGLYSPEEARQKVARNILTHALGLEDQARVDVAEHVVQAGDRYLLCSDGLYEMVSDSEIAALLGRPLPLGDICAALVELANAKGGKDNITVVAIET
ncbi:MAG TPA: Stp1/IreP family PP2C-type Ser/Thr phosphatase [Moraxellaceae bacterium]|nr:Stp1/IreP family PP2C-type Ser/Thr phosphatase [Moraxellaceae bacterium]